MKLNAKTKTFLSYLFRFGISAFLLVYLFRKIDTEQFLETIRTADARFILYGLLVFFVINFIILTRWTLIIRALGLRIPCAVIAKYFLVGLFFNLFLPTSTGGDVIKTIGLCQFTPEKAKVVASAVLDRVCGFMAIVFVAFIAYLFGHTLINDTTLLVGIGLVSLVPLSLLLILFNEKIYSFGCRLFNRWPKIKDAVMQLHYDVVLLRDRKRAFWAAIGISMVSQVTLSTVSYLVAKALHQDIPFVYFLIFIPLICVASSLPSIGGLGVRDAGSVYLFAKIGIGSATAIGISLVNFAFMVFVGLIGGIVYVTALSPGWIQHHQESAGTFGQKT